MKTNLGDVKHLDRLARSVGARRILVSHVLPYSEAMEKEMLCLQTLTLETFTFAPGKTELSLPRIDVNNTTKETLFSLFQGFENLTFMGNRIAVDARRCRFVHERTAFVRWDGQVSPCMGLLHSHRTSLYGLERRVRAHDFGDVREVTSSTSGVRRPTPTSGTRSRPSTTRPATSAAAARSSRRTRRTATATRFRPAAAACGPRGSSNAHERHRQDLQGLGRPDPPANHAPAASP